MRKVKKRPRYVLSRNDAVQRIEQMIVSIEKDVRLGLRIEAALETANEIVTLEIGTVNCYGADCYNVVKDSMALSLALTLARLFDVGTRRFHPNRREVASIPLLIRLLKQKRCQTVFIERARNWKTISISKRLSMSGAGSPAPFGSLR